jgi:hypothetical protein
MGARHTRLGDAQFLNVALMPAHFLHQIAHRVAQGIHLFGGKTELHQPVGNLLLQLVVRFAAIAMFLIRLAHLCEQIVDDGKAFQRILLELGEVGRSKGFAIVTFLVIFVFIPFSRHFLAARFCGFHAI